MKSRYLLLIPFLFIATSFRVQPSELIWIGTIEVFFDPETNEFIVSYDGNYNRCFTKYIIDHIYNDCDLIIDNKALDERFQWENEPINSSKIPIDTCLIEPKKRTFQL